MMGNKPSNVRSKLEDVLRIGELMEENKKLRKEVSKLEKENARYKNKLRKAGKTN